MISKKSTIASISLFIIVLFFLGLLGYILYDSIKELEKAETYSQLGPYGDYIGGILNPFISVFAVFAAGLAFYAQYQANRQVQEQFEKQETREYKINFETKFFELIKIHRENVSELNYNIYNSNNTEIATGRKVFRLMHKELSECIKEVIRYRKMYPQNFITPKYTLKLERIINSNNLDVNIIELAIIDLAYTIFFYGLGKESEDYLLNNFKGKYDYLYFKRLIKYLQLKPIKENQTQYKAWKKFTSLPVAELRDRMNVIYLNRKNKNFVYHFNHINLFNNYQLYKYYGGHQHRLGHYFRHLYQSYKFLYTDNIISDNDKYFYGKTLRGQISSYEQTIFFINSVSSLGFKWELYPEKNKKGEKMLFMSKFQIIKNVPGNKFLDIKYEKYYPNVKFDFLER